jgi:ankyrin repeat protein
MKSSHLHVSIYAKLTIKKHFQGGVYVGTDETIQEGYVETIEEVFMIDNVSVEQFIRAAGTGDTETVARYIADGGDINAAGPNGGNTALMAVAGSPFDKEAKMLSYLVKQGAKVNAANIDGNTPLHEAAGAGNVKAVKLLLDRGADPKAADKSARLTPLHNAAFVGNVEAMKLLLEKGADIKAVDTSGNTPLHIAAGTGKVEAMKLLLDRGADIKAVDKRGNTPLHMAAAVGKVEALGILVEHGGRLGTKNNDGKTPIDVLKQIL